MIKPSKSDDFFDRFFEGPNSSVAGWNPPREYPASATIYRQDTPATTVYLVESGIVKLSWVDSSGREVIAGLRRRHWIMGVTSIFLNRPYAFTARTLIRSTLRCISAKDFKKLVDTEREFSRHMLTMLSQEIYTQGKNFVHLGCLNAKDRLKRLLYEIIIEMDKVSSGKSELRIRLPLKQLELAQMIAVTPEHLSRMLKVLERDGVIQRDGNWLKVKDYRALVSECKM